jgi:hypothetical protein
VPCTAANRMDEARRRHLCEGNDLCGVRFAIPLERDPQHRYPLSSQPTRMNIGMCCLADSAQRNTAVPITTLDTIAPG